VLVQEPCQDDLELRDTTPRAVWARILEPLATLRKEMGGVQVFPRFVSGEDLFGLTEPAVVRVLESLPGKRIGCDNYLIEISQSCSIVATEYLVAVGTREERNTVAREV
jgi:hypothetical protein